MEYTRKIKPFVVFVFTKAHNKQTKQKNKNKKQKNKKGGGGGGGGGRRRRKNDEKGKKEKDGIVWLKYNKDLTEHRCHTTLDTAVGFTLNAGCICKEIRWGWGKKQE